MVNVEKGTIVRNAEDGVIRFHPYLKNQQPKWRDRGIAGKNVGSWFSFLYAAAYDGTPAANGGGGFHPDVVKETLYGDTLTEVKACSLHASQAKCGVAQLRGYGEELLDRIEAGQDAPSVDYVMFRYGTNTTSPSTFTKRQLVANLPRMVKKLLVIPYNLALARAVVSPYQPMNHFSSGSTRDEEGYRIIRAGGVNFMLNDPLRALEGIHAELRSKDLGDLIVEDFHLGDLTYGRKQFPDNIRCWGWDVKSFPVVHFDLADSRPWLNTFYDKSEAFFNVIREPEMEEVPI